MLPQLFIGSSVENLKIAYAIRENLEHDAHCTVWTQGVFDLSASTIDSLLEALQQSDFGVFVFSPDDVTRMRDSEVRSVRDNVVFELGLFVGRLGKERTYIVVPRKAEGLHLPTDILSMTPASYEADRPDKNWAAALGNAGHQIRKMMEKHGRRPEPRQLQNAKPSIPLTDDEIIAVLQSWFGGLHDADRKKVIYFERVDADLGLPPGASAKFLHVAAESVRYKVVRRGPSLILFAYSPPPPPRLYVKKDLV